MKMKRLFALCAAFFLIFAATVFPQKDPRVLKFPDLEFKPQKPDLVSIKKGVDFYFKENHELPTINSLIIIRSGSLNDPKDKAGLASLTMRLLKSGGTKNLTPDKVEEKLDFLGTTISTYASNEFSQIVLSTLSKNFDESWKILEDMLSNPLFDKERLETEKKKELENIRRRWDYPSSVGMYLFDDLVYGKDFPDVKRTTSAGIESMTVDDVKNFYENNIRDAALIVAFAGDFNTQKIKELLTDTFKNWKGKAPAKLALPKAALATQPGLFLINKEDMTQAIICMGHLGINRLDPDSVEINIMNFILGTGSFNSRLMREVRSNRGLAYATFGYVGQGRDLGMFFSFCQTKSQSVGEAIKLMKDIIADMTANPVKPEELETAKKYEQNAFVHRFDSAMSVLMETIYGKIMGYPENYLETYIPRIKKVDLAKVLAMAKRTMNPNGLVILVVGKKSELIDQLKALNLGEVKELPLPKE